MFSWNVLAQGADMDSWNVALVLIFVMIFICFTRILLVAGKALVIKKAGGSWWKALIPVLSDIELCRISGTNIIWAYLNFVAMIGFMSFSELAFFASLVMLFYNCILSASVAKSFGKGFSITVGLIFLPFIFYIIVGCTQNKYAGPLGCYDPFFEHVEFGNTKIKKNETVVKNTTTETSKYNFCYSCGYKLSSHDKFCPGCGRKL